MCYKRVGFNLNVMRQSACLIINPITVDGFAALFNWTPVDSFKFIWTGASICCLVHRGSTDDLLLHLISSGVV